MSHNEIDPKLKKALLERYDSKSQTITDLASEFHLSRQRIRGYAARLNLTHQRGRAWTEKERDYVIAHFSRVSVEAMAKKLKRTKEAVKREAHRLGINKKADGYTLNGVCELLHCYPNRLHAWIAAGWLQGSRRQSERDNDFWYFSKESIRDLLFKHPYEIDRYCQIKWFDIVDIVCDGRNGIGELYNPTQEKENESA